MKRILLATAAIALTGTLLVAGARASDDDRSGGNLPEAGWMSVGEIAAKLEGQGYTVREIEIEHGVYDVEMIDANGMRVEAYLDPSSGEPVRHDDDGDRHSDD